MSSYISSPTNGTPTQSSRRVLLISIPRTASNLLLKILNLPSQPNVYTNEKGGYFFYWAFIAAARGGYLEKSAEEWTKEEKDDIRAIYQDCFEKIEKCSGEAETKNKTMFAKEHSFWVCGPASCHKKWTGVHNEEFFNAFRVDIPEKYGSTRTYSPLNETVFSDEYLRSWQMVFIIRHPALTWPSFWRAMIKFSKEGIIDEDGVQGTTMINMDLRWSRSLYDWNLQQDGRLPPPVLDAYDLIHNPKVVLKFCEQVGIAPDALQFEWNAQSVEADHWESAEKEKLIAAQGDGIEEMHVRGAHIMFNTLSHSSGILKDKAPVDVDIPSEVMKWKVEFGEEVAGLIEKAVWDTMPDYEYLKARRVTV